MDRGTIERFRLMLFGRMITGVAHEIDNHLSVVLGFAELLQLTADNEKKVHDGSGKILGAGDRINRIVKAFSQHVRPHEPRRELFSPAEMLPELLVFSRYDLGRGNVAVEFPSEVPAGLAYGDRRDIALALLCLLFNGSEAMGEPGAGGVLQLGVERTEEGWLFRVTDDGPGLTPEVLREAFLAGFSTKSAPHHQGLGLSVAKALAEDCGGKLSLENRPLKGCVATFTIPARKQAG